MKFYVAFACLLAVAGVSHGYSIGHIGAPLIAGPLLAPAAVSTANQWRGAPIPVVRTVVAPVLSPIIRPLGLPYATAWGNGLWASNPWGYGYGYGYNRGAWH